VTSSSVTALLAVIFIALSRVTVAHGQGLSADVSAGRLVYDPVSANITTNNVIGSLRYDTRRELWIYGAGAVPASDQGTFWGAAGMGGRVILSAPQAGRASVGADVGAHGFSFRDRVVDQDGTGGTLEAMPFARLAVGMGFLEGRGGWRGHTLSFAGARESRRVFETGVRGGYGTTLRVEGDARWVHASEGTYPFVGATVAYAGSRVDVWGQTGKWLATDLGERVWAVGGGVSLGPRTSLWGSVRQEAPDPLYWSSTRRTWSVGLTQRLGRIPAPLVPVSRSQEDTVVLRLSVTDAPAGPVSIAGDFNNWQPAAMEREGGEWIVRLPLSSGVYHYAFRAANGDWFVPPSTPGRRDDGMGGFVAVLVVS
jgi:Glycogen recognition site of AMP-activated protein kinase